MYTQPWKRSIKAVQLLLAVVTHVYSVMSPQISLGPDRFSTCIMFSGSIFLFTPLDNVRLTLAHPLHRCCGLLQTFFRTSSVQHKCAETHTAVLCFSTLLQYCVQHTTAILCDRSDKKIDAEKIMQVLKRLSTKLICWPTAFMTIDRDCTSWLTGCHLSVLSENIYI